MHPQQYTYSQAFGPCGGGVWLKYHKGVQRAGKTTEYVFDHFLLTLIPVFCKDILRTGGIRFNYIGKAY